VFPLIPQHRRDGAPAWLKRADYGSLGGGASGVFAAAALAAMRSSLPLAHHPPLE